VRTLLVAVALALGVYVVAVAALAVAGRRTAAKEMAAFLPNLARLFKGLIGDDRVPRSSKVLLVFGAAWIASPIDLIPEFIPVLGPLDDAVVAALILRRVLKTAGTNVVADHWRGDPATLRLLLRLSALRPEDPREGRSRSG
jgi:uncharacterized membrane protein YkvA (DUF1232 family)